MPDDVPKKRGRKPTDGEAFDDRTMVRMFKVEHAAWKQAAAALSKKLGVPVSVSAFIRRAANELSKKAS